MIVCPSNPYVSIDPIVELDGIKPALAECLTVAVSPIVDGRAVKGPLASMIGELTGRPPSAQAVLEHYRPWLDGAVIQSGDQVDWAPLLSTDTVMKTRQHRLRLAAEVLDFAKDIR